ncbi:ribonuclease III [Candidatus Dojkabacteria bacterium]|nr:ribonuclease III [Candidatus Dojkabacteria bacterium]
MNLTTEDKLNIEKLEQILGIKFNNPEILKQSLIHKSYLNEKSGAELESNERLEYLGDAVLELIVTSFLFSKYPNRPEGDLTSFRAALVKTESLAETAMSLEYGHCLYMSKGEEGTGGRERPYILANTFEAVLGAIYLDQGYEIANNFVIKALLPKLEDIVENRLDIDNKSKLQNLAQEILKDTPTYELLNENGPDHDKEFEIRVIIANNDFGHGKGKSKQEAEQAAANKALEDWEILLKKYSKKIN